MAKRPAAGVERILNLVPSRNTETDWAFATALQANVAAAAAPPPSVDLRAAWWDIGDQERTGSCVGWAAADGVARYHFVKAGRLTKSKKLSPRFVWMASKETDTLTTRPESFIEEAGTMLKAAADIMRKYGTALETALPFHIATNLFLGRGDTFYADAAMRKIASYFNLRKNINDWKQWLASEGPILAGFSVDNAWSSVGANGMVGDFQPGTVRGGHAIAIVGYRADGRFIVRNSWGTGWGHNGFAYVTPNYIAAAFFNESYGVKL